MSGQWWEEHRAAVPALCVLLAVVVLWSVGTVGGVRYLHDASSLMVILGGLYVMLVAVALSVIIVVIALDHLLQHFSRSR